MTLGPKHRKTSWAMLGCVGLLLVILLVYGTYAALREPQTQRGAAGALIHDGSKSQIAPDRAR